MENRELLIRAKSYIDKMANGINPMTDQPAPENDTINQVRVTRCLFYVSDVLRKLIEEEKEDREQAEQIKEKPETRGKKKQFWLSVDDLNAFAFSDTPIPISEIARRLNDLKTDEGMKRFSRRLLSNWLIETGLLESFTTQDGVTVKRPTEQGGEIGILSETRRGMYGDHTVVLYNREAQQFILDNFYSILESE